MRPDSIEVSSEPVKTEPIARVERARPKEREQRQREADERARKKKQRDEPDTAEKPPATAQDSDVGETPQGGKSHVGGKRLDLVV